MKHWLTAIHHDGSAMYVSNPLPTLGETVEIRLRLPADAPINAVYLRTWPDGEQRDRIMQPLHVAQPDSLVQWYGYALKVHNPITAYCFKLGSVDGQWYFYNGRGISRVEDVDLFTFKLVADFAAPSWVRDAVFYQIFPDRFHNGDPTRNPVDGQSFQSPDGRDFQIQLRDWDNDEPLSWHEGGSLDFFGGDLTGIAAKIDYLQDLGITALYLNPIFSSITNHKYNINDFHHVDAHFGGDEGLVALREALRDADMRLMLDVTPNHCGSDHPWFTAAQSNADSEESEYFIFHEHPDGYEMWHGVPTLPKLDYTSPALRNVMYNNETSVLKHWLQPPFAIDAWRLDVWNMTARQQSVMLNDEVGREMRVAVKSVNADAYLIGESFFDATPNLQGDQLDAVQNYRGFSNPVWRWLSGRDTIPVADSVRPVPIDAAEAAAQMQQYIAAVPWVIARQQFNQLSSHDVPRILSMMDENEALARVATAILLTFPGVPCIYYGDEIGMTGDTHSERHRRPMPWDTTRWNHDLRAYHQQLVQLRRTSDALINGGIQFLVCDGPLLTYVRQTDADCVLVVAHRGAATSTSAALPVWQAGIADGTVFDELLTDERVTVDGGMLSLGFSAEPRVMILQLISPTTMQKV